MRNFIRILSLLLLTLFLSCEKQGLFVNCSDCTTDEPLKADLEIKIDFNYSQSSVRIDVYEGNLEDNILYSTFYSSSTTTTIPVTLNKKYTLTATYLVSDNYYIAVDSATPGVKYEKNQCNNPCYFVYDRNIDLRIKHY